MPVYAEVVAELVVPAYEEHDVYEEGDGDYEVDGYVDKKATRCVGLRVDAFTAPDPS